MPCLPQGSLLAFSKMRFSDTAHRVMMKLLFVSGYFAGQANSTAYFVRGYSIKNGKLLGARQCVSPNFDARPANTDVELLVIHSISLPPGEYGGAAIIDFFANQLDSTEHPYFEQICSLKVSSHLLIRRDGEVIQFVDFNARAWHAGESCYQGRERCNDFSVGIELEGTDTDTFSDAQYQALAEVTEVLLHSYKTLSPHNIVGHEYIAPGRKTDPGTGFDWQRYRAMLIDNSTD